LVLSTRQQQERRNKIKSMQSIKKIMVESTAISYKDLLVGKASQTTQASKSTLPDPCSVRKEDIGKPIKRL
jgi:hypothetical protein